MRFSLFHVPVILLTFLPLYVAYNGYGIIVATFLVLLVGGVRQATVMENMKSRRHDKRIILNTLPVSHYVEKVRWSMDRLKFPYEEEKDIGIFGALFCGRMVPELRIPGKNICISNSSDILRYIYGLWMSVNPQKCDFLKPSPEAIEWEQKLDRMGIDLRTYVYYEALINSPDPDNVALTLWGIHEDGIPPWQKVLLKLTLPLLKKFLIFILGIDAERAKLGLEASEKIFKEVEDALEKSQGKYIMDTQEPTFVDITFASLAAILALPENYGGPNLGPDSRPNINIHGPEGQQAVQKFRTTLAGKFVLRMYAEHR